MFGPLLVAALCAWLAAEWNSPEAGALFTPGLVFYAAWPVLLAAAALRGLDERPLGRAGWIIVAIGAPPRPAPRRGFGGPLRSRRAGLRRVPREPAADRERARRRPRPRPPASPSRVVGRRLLRGRGRRLVRLAGPAPLGRPSLVPAALAIALFGAAAAHGLGRGYLSSDPTDRALRSPRRSPSC